MHDDAEATGLPQDGEARLRQLVGKFKHMRSQEVSLSSGSSKRPSPHTSPSKAPKQNGLPSWKQNSNQGPCRLSNKNKMKPNRWKTIDKQYHSSFPVIEVIRSCTFDANDNQKDNENGEEITRIRREKKASLKLEDHIGSSDNNNKYFLELGQLMDTMNQLKVSSKRISPQVQQEFLTKAHENMEFRKSGSDPFGFMIQLTPETPQFKCQTPIKRSSNSEINEKEFSEIHKTILKNQEGLDERLRKVEDEIQKKQFEILSESESKDQLRRLLQRSSERMKHQESIKTEELERLKDEKERIEQAIFERDRSRLRREKNIEEYQEELEKKNKAIELLLKELKESEVRRISYNEILMNLNGNLYNYCKIKRIEQQEKRVIHVPKFQNKEITFEFSDPLAQGTMNSKHKESFFFDKVFGEGSSIDELYKHIEPNIASVGDGKPTSLILVGSPESGKPETLYGSTEFEFGLLQMCIDSLLNNIYNRNFLSDSKDHLEIRFSCLEIYNEKLNDLLGSSKNEDEVKIMMEKGRVVLPDIEKPVINSVADALAVIRQSSRRRQTEATVMERSLKSKSLDLPHHHREESDWTRDWAAEYYRHGGV
jgi:hypothetical protein